MPYKAFNKDFACKGKQYEENTTYEENGSEICKEGVMHYCNNPFDVLNYYPLVNNDGEISEFAKVEPLGDIYEKEDICATNKLHIGAKLGLKGFVKTCIDFTLERTKVETTGFVDTKSDNGGNGAKIGSSGNGAQIGSSGYWAQIGSSGDGAKIGSSGYGAQIGSSGDGAKIDSSGYRAKIGSSGNEAKITSNGKHSVVMAAGYDSIAKAKIGSWITLAEWVRTDDRDEKNNYIWIPKCVKSEYVDGKRIKEDTFYKLVDGEFKEVEE